MIFCSDSIYLATNMKMKNIITLLIPAIILTSIRPAFANRNITGDDVGHLMGDMGLSGSLNYGFNDQNKNLCDKTTDFRYVSPNLQSSDQQLTIYFEVMWRRQPRLNQNYVPCSGAASTPESTIIITKGRKIKKKQVKITLGNEDFIMYKPISFSPALNYVLFGRTHIAPEPEDEYVFFNLEKNSEEVVPLKCLFPEYKGFISAAEVVFGCLSERKIFVTFNLNTHKISQSNIPVNTKYYSYGNSKGRFSVTKIDVSD